MLAINVPNSGKRRARAKSQTSEYIAFENRVRDFVSIWGARPTVWIHLRLLNEDCRSYDCQTKIDMSDNLYVYLCKYKLIHAVFTSESGQI